ncbi:MAG: tail protein X [Oscillospiraceae bacterium]|nr:tail protein X [Oscillospiraceae bacterium]
MAKTCITTSGDMWDAVALREMGSEMHKDALLKANPRHNKLYILPANIMLTIPEVAVVPPDSLPPWKRG